MRFKLNIPSALVFISIYLQVLYFLLHKIGNRKPINYCQNNCKVGLEIKQNMGQLTMYSLIFLSLSCWLTRRMVAILSWAATTFLMKFSFLLSPSLCISVLGPSPYTNQILCISGCHLRLIILTNQYIYKVRNFILHYIRALTWIWMRLEQANGV